MFQNPSIACAPKPLVLQSGRQTFRASKLNLFPHFPSSGARNKVGTTALELAQESPDLLLEMQEQLRIRGQGDKVDETLEVRGDGLAVCMSACLVYFSNL